MTPSAKPRVLITGGAGFIGSHVARRFINAGYEVYLYDSFVVYTVPDPRKPSPNFAFRLADIYDHVKIIRGSTLDKDFLRRTLIDLQPQTIVHMAALPLAAVAIEHTEEAFQSILNSTQNILEILRDMKSHCRLVFISSSMVYGDFKVPEVDEEQPREPKDIYGAFKLAGEIIVSAYSKNYGIEYVTIRPSAVYGPTDTNNRVIQIFLNNALQGKPITLDGDGSMKLDFTFVEDCALGIFLAATKPEASRQTFNITRGEGRSLKDLVTIIQQYLPDTKILHRDVPKYMPFRGTLSIAKAGKLLGFKPEVTLEMGVRRYLEHLQKKNAF